MMENVNLFLISSAQIWSICGTHRKQLDIADDTSDYKASYWRHTNMFISSQGDKGYMLWLPGVMLVIGLMSAIGVAS